MSHHINVPTVGAGSPSPWQIGRPQPAVLGLADTRQLRGRLLDLGCGTGHNAILAAQVGASVVGIDIDPDALAEARRAAAADNVEADFRRLGIEDLDGLDAGPFDVILDSLLFQALSPRLRARYVDNVTALAAPEATLFVLAYAAGQVDIPHHLEPGGLRRWFEPRWLLESATRTIVDTRRHPLGASGWLYSLRIHRGAR